MNESGVGSGGGMDAPVLLPNAAEPRYLTLEAMRGMGAICVMLGHIRMTLGVGPDFPASGYLGVDIFFLLSGFVIAHAYHDRLASGALGPVRFMLLRAIRLWPMVILGTLLAAARLACLPVATDDLSGPVRIGTATVFNILFLPVPPGFSRWMFPTDDPQWSLFFELAVNLVFALGALRLRRMPLVLLIAALGLAEAALSFHYGGLNAGFYSHQYPAGLVRAGFSFALGVVLRRNQDAILRRLPNIPVPVLLVIGAVMLGVNVQGPARAVYDVLFVVLLSPLLIACAAKVEPDSRFARLALWLGAISYPLYMLHYPVVQALLATTPAGSGPRVALSVVAAIGLPLLCQPLLLWYDVPMRRRLKAILRRATGYTPPVASPSR